PAGGHGSSHALGKGIVTAGVEDYQPQLFGGFDHAQQPIEWNSFVERVDVTLEYGVNRDQIVRSVDLDTVTREIDDRYIGVPRSIGEIADCAPHQGGSEIASQLH